MVASSQGRDTVALDYVTDAVDASMRGKCPQSLLPAKIA
jgi:hypothetical protein